MHDIVDITVAPNDKYAEVIWGELPGTDDVPETEEEYLEEADHHEVANAYQELIAEAPTAEDLNEDPDEIEPLSWDDISVSKDADLVAKMATYFEGMSPDEATERIRAKLRLLSVDVYADAQLAAREELRE